MTAIIPTTLLGAQRLTRNALTELNRGRVPQYRVWTAPADAPTPIFDGMAAELVTFRWSR